MSGERKSNWEVVALFTALHLLCCGLPLLLFSGVSFAFLAPKWPYIGATVAVLGIVGFAWYRKRRCSTCPEKERFFSDPLTFHLTGMVCEGCAQKITTTLTALPGVREVKPKVPQKHVYVRYEPGSVQAEALKDALTKAGFTAVEA